jgi:hypothetical protein
MERLSIGIDGGGGGGEKFGLDCHDWSLKNVFGDEDDHSKIVRLVNSPSFINIIPLLRPALSTGSRRQSDHSGRRPRQYHADEVNAMSARNQLAHVRTTSRDLRTPKHVQDGLAQ